MPELPEVEVARENLERWLAGRVILRVRVRDPRLLRGQSSMRLARSLRGARVRAVRRRGKFLLWDLGNRGQVVAHLGMSGKFVLKEASEPDPPAACLELGLSAGRRLIYDDPRRFGRFQLLDAEVARALEDLGVEPLDDRFTPAVLRRLLSSSRRAIKPMLLDQRRIAGLGNIHAAEALFLAGIHPERKASGLTPSETRRLHTAIRRTLKRTLDRDRAEDISYLKERNADNRFLVYGHENEPCPRCASRIRRFAQGSRSTYFCPSCQKSGEASGRRSELKSESDRPSLAPRRAPPRKLEYLVSTIPSRGKR